MLKQAFEFIAECVYLFLFDPQGKRSNMDMLKFCLGALILLGAWLVFVRLWVFIRDRIKRTKAQKKKSP